MSKASRLLAEAHIKGISQCRCTAGCVCPPIKRLIPQRAAHRDHRFDTNLVALPQPLSLTIADVGETPEVVERPRKKAPNKPEPPTTPILVQSEMGDKRSSAWGTASTAWVRRRRIVGASES